MTFPAHRLTGDRRAPGRGDLQRARLIEALVDLLRTTSIAELSVMQIAKQAGVTRGVFYFYFESKYSVLAAALNQVWVEFAAARTLTPDVDLTQPPTLLVRALTRDAVAIWYRHHALIAAATEARSSDAQVAGLWDALIGQTARQVCQVIGVLKATGRVRPTFEDLPALVDTLFGMTIWALLGTGGSDDPEARNKTVDVITAIWVASVWGPEATVN